MSNEATTTKKKKAATSKKAVRKTAKKKTRKASEKTAARTSRLKPNEREDIKRKLIAHFGTTKIGGALEPCLKKKDYETVLLQWKKKMEQEIEAEERNVVDYYKEIDAEYKAVGRPKSVFNWREFEFLCSIGCTLDELAGFFQMSKSAVQDRVKEEYGETFTERYEKLSQGIKISLRRRQIKSAMDGSDTMLKFLGKNVLGQKEQIDFEGEVKVNSWVDLMNNLDPNAEKEETKKDESDGKL